MSLHTTCPVTSLLNCGDCVHMCSFEAIHDGLFQSRPGKASQKYNDLSTRWVIVLAVCCAVLCVVLCAVCVLCVCCVCAVCVLCVCVCFSITRPCVASYPEHYLITSIKKPPPVDPESLLPPLPPALAEIRRLQKKNGSWEPSDRLYAALGGNIPDPPEGVSRWRWATALTVVFIQRHPELHAALNPVFEASREWTADPHLMRSASEALPPAFTEQPAYFPLNETALKARRWQDAAKQLVERVGYRPFVPKDLRFSTLYRGTHDEAEWFRSLEEAERTREYVPSDGRPLEAKDAGDDDDECDNVARPGSRMSRRSRPATRGGQSTVSGVSSAPPDDASSVASSQPPVDPDVSEAMRILAEHKAQKAKDAGVLKAHLTPPKVRRARRRHKRGLRFEWSQAGKRPEAPMRQGEKVCCVWRRGERWEQPVATSFAAPAVIARQNLDGTVDLTYLDAPYERENGVPRK